METARADYDVRLRQSPRKPRPAARSLRANGWVPQQHGAWAMLITPFVLGAVVRVRADGWSWWILTLFAGWMLGYFAFAAGSLWLKSARKPRYRTALATYSALAAVCGVSTLVVTGPALLGWALAYLPLTAVTLWLVAHKKERATASGMLTIGAAALMVVTVVHPNPFDALTPAAGSVWGLAALTFAYFFGTVPYVKTLVRERGQASWVFGSVVYHVFVLGLTVVAVMGGLLSWWWPAFFTLTAARALLVPGLGPMSGRTVTPKQAGIGEIVCTALFLLLALLTG